MRRIILSALIVCFFFTRANAQSPLVTLTQTLQAACAQVVGVSIGDVNDKATWTIFYAPGATCQAAAAAALASFDPNAIPVGEKYGQLVQAGLTVSSTA